MQVLTFLKGGKFEKISRWMWEDKNYKEVLYTSPHPEIHPSHPTGATSVFAVLFFKTVAIVVTSQCFVSGGGRSEFQL